MTRPIAMITGIEAKPAKIKLDVAKKSTLNTMNPIIAVMKNTITNASKTFLNLLISIQQKISQTPHDCCPTQAVPIP